MARSVATPHLRTAACSPVPSPSRAKRARCTSPARLSSPCTSPTQKTPPTKTAVRVACTSASRLAGIVPVAGLSAASFERWHDGAADSGSTPRSPNLFLGGAHASDGARRRRAEYLVPTYGVYEEEPSDAELSATPGGAVCFKASDGAKISQGGRVARQQRFCDARVGLVSSDVVHVDHATPSRTWIVQVRTAQRPAGDIFVGLTEASVPWGVGGTFGFDVRGGFCSGATPQDTPVKHGSRQVPPTAVVDRLSTFSVTADLQQGVAEVSVWPNLDDERPAWRCSMALENANAARTQKKPWRSARLFVTLSSVDDAVEIVEAWANDVAA